MTDHPGSRSAETAFHAEPAARAWRQLRLHQPPRAVELLKSRRAAIYRLHGAGPGGADVLAKHGSRKRLEIERVFYEEVLPSLPLRSLRSYGFVEDCREDSSWLFLEDAGPQHDVAIGDRLDLLVNWLRALHAARPSPELCARLPARDPAHYSSRLRSIRESIERHGTNPALRADQRSILSAVLEQCDRVDSLWGRLVSACSIIPPSYVHGDLVDKNLRVEQKPDGPTLLVFDWEVAGWGMCAPDLVAFRFDVRESQAGQSEAALSLLWPRLGSSDLRRLADAGVILWLLGVLSGGVRSLDHRWLDRPMAKVEVYRQWLGRAIERFGER